MGICYLSILTSQGNKQPSDTGLCETSTGELFDPESRDQVCPFSYEHWIGITKKKNKNPSSIKAVEKKCPVVQLRSRQLNFCIPIVLNFRHIFPSTHLQINLFCFPAKSWVGKKENAAFSHPEKEFSLNFGYWWIKIRTPCAYISWDVLPCDQAQWSHQGRTLCYLYEAAAFYESASCY